MQYSPISAVSGSDFCSSLISCSLFFEAGRLSMACLVRSSASVTSLMSGFFLLFWGGRGGGVCLSLWVFCLFVCLFFLLVQSGVPAREYLLRSEFCPGRLGEI